MENQNFKNHARFVLGYHVIGFGLLVILLILSIINFFQVFGSTGWIFSGLMPLLTCIIIILVASFTRSFPLKAQDRAIRAEENLRHYVLTGKLLDAKLSIGQIIALRFAPDDEFPTLAARAVKENLSNKEIKQAIINWKADNHRA